MSCNPPSLPEIQTDFEQRFNCMICLSARLDLIWGHCQHKACAECLYKEGFIRDIFLKCPVCLQAFAFPVCRPLKIEDNVEMLKNLGVRCCLHQNRGCAQQMWEWEQEKHARVCAFRPKTPQLRKAGNKSSSPRKQPALAVKRVTRSSKQLRRHHDNKGL